MIRKVVRKLYSIYKGLRAKVATKVRPWAARGRLRSSFYYTFFSDAFQREHYAVLSGIQAYEETAKNAALNSSRLRRNIHGFEKGLTMVPRKPLFALGYLDNTLESLEKALTGENDLDEAEMDWAVDVLTEYFKATDGQAEVVAARERFVNMLARYEKKEAACTKTPIMHKELPEGGAMGYEELELLARRRVSVRWFLQKKVPENIIENAVKVAAQSPSACNRQPFHFRVYNDEELVRKLAPIPMGTAGYSHNIPVIVLITARLNNYFDERDRHLIYIDASLAAMSFILGIESQGANSCCLNWPDIREKEAAVRKIVSLEPDERIIMFMAVGYADPEGKVAWSEKKSLQRLLSFNRV